LTNGYNTDTLLSTIKKGKSMIEVIDIDTMVFRAAQTIVNTPVGQGLDAFDLSYAMAVFTGKPKQECLDLILDKQVQIRKIKDKNNS